MDGRREILKAPGRRGDRIGLSRERDGRGEEIGAGRDGQMNGDGGGGGGSFAGVGAGSVLACPLPRHGPYRPVAVVGTLTVPYASSHRANGGRSTRKP